MYHTSVSVPVEVIQYLLVEGRTDSVDHPSSSISTPHMPRVYSLVKYCQGHNHFTFWNLNYLSKSHRSNCNSLRLHGMGTLVGHFSRANSFHLA